MFLTVYAIVWLAFAAMQSPSLKPSMPETFWPTSFVAWGAAGGFLLLLVKDFYKLWRHSQSPIEKKIEEGNEACLNKIDERFNTATHQIDDTVRHFEKEVKRVEQDFKEQLIRFSASEVERRNIFRESVTGELNGLGIRVNSHDTQIDRIEQAIESQARAFIEFKTESKADRQHINNRLGSVEGKIDMMAAAQAGVPLQIVKAVQDGVREALRKP
jgi:hypothetical protein